MIRQDLSASVSSGASSSFISATFRCSVCSSISVSICSSIGELREVMISGSGSGPMLCGDSSTMGPVPSPPIPGRTSSPSIAGTAML